jgi:ATP-dependent protease Clp ATPase subunit
LSKRVTSTDMDGNALSLRSIVCAEELLDVLRQSIVGNPTPIMLIGEEGSGKHYIAMRLAAALLCDEPDDKDGACGSCPSCRSLAQG